MDRADRVKAIEALLARVENAGTPKRCIDCRYARDADYTMGSECRNPIAEVQILAQTGGSRAKSWPNHTTMRSSSGLCGPEALLFKERSLLDNAMFWKQPTMDRQFLVGLPVGCLFLFSITVTLALLLTAAF